MVARGYMKINEKMTEGEKKNGNKSVAE